MIMVPKERDANPVRNWKIENDLWHHPRKYIVPLIMFLIAGLIGMWSVSIWVLITFTPSNCSNRNGMTPAITHNPAVFKR